MKKILALLVGAALVAAVAVPLLAYGPGWGRGHHMMGPWGTAPGYSQQYERGFGNLTEEQRSQLEQLDRKYYDETATLRDKIWDKSDELNALLNGPNPDAKKVKALQRELSDLQAMMDEKRLSYELEIRKIIPEPQFGRGYGRGYYGHHMGGYGPHMGYGWHGRGYGPGSCWN
jgi:zinc resistance-associated protein